jgi:hypothetical protein
VPWPFTQSPSTQPPQTVKGRKDREKQIAAVWKIFFMTLSPRFFYVSFMACEARMLSLISCLGRIPESSLSWKGKLSPIFLFASAQPFKVLPKIMPLFYGYLEKLSFFPISALFKKIYHRNINYMPAVNFFSRLGLEQKS